MLFDDEDEDNPVRSVREPDADVNEDAEEGEKDELNPRALWLPLLVLVL